jgi:hypothetical protein
LYTGEFAETGAAALLFALIFLAGGRLHPLRAFVRDRRTMISFGAGMSVAYVFIHVMPEMHDVRRAFAASVAWTLRFEGMGIYFLALVGFLVSYGLDHLREHLGEPEAPGEAGSAFWVHIGGFAVYVMLMAYLLVNDLEETRVTTLVFAVAIAFHFLSVDHALRIEHGAAYDRMGRYILAGMAMVGWGVGQLLVLPQHVLALAIAFVSGAIIMNSAIMELPSDKDGRFLPFLMGGVLYGLLLLPLG